MHARVILLMLAAATVVLIAGCGGGDEGTEASAGSSGEPTVATSSLSKEEFVSRAGKACQRLRKNILTGVLTYMQKHESNKPTRSEETALFAEAIRAALLPTIRKEMAEIRSLGAPEGDEDEVEAFLDAEQEAVEQVAKLKHIVSRFQLERYFVTSAKLFTAYGLSACANGEET